MSWPKQKSPQGGNTMSCERWQHQYQFVSCHMGEEEYRCIHCGDERRQYADTCSGG